MGPSLLHTAARGARRPCDAAARACRIALGVAAIGALGGCNADDTILIGLRDGHALEQVDVYVRDQQTRKVVLHTGWSDVSKRKDPQLLELGITLPKPGDYSVFVFGLKGRRDCLPGFNAADAGAGPGDATQYYHAFAQHFSGNVSVEAAPVDVTGHDADCDLFPDAAAGIAPNLLDCNDADPAINPFATEQCGNDVDEDCDGQKAGACVDSDGDGDPDNHDCKPNDPKIHFPTKSDPYPESANCCGYTLGKTGKEAGETFDEPLCHPATCDDGIDQDCDGKDEPCKRDYDCDTHLASDKMQAACAQPANVPPGDDCNDCDKTVYRDAPEVCDGKDNDCNGLVDETCIACDLDGDGYQRLDPANSCPDPKTDRHPGTPDCNDEDRGIFPGSSMNVDCGKLANVVTCALRGYCAALRAMPRREVDCDGAPTGCPPAECDQDGDGVVDAVKKNDAQCDPGGGRAPVYDCNDKDPTVFYGAPEKCGDGIDQDCDGKDLPCAGLTDADGDGYYASNPGRSDFNDCDDQDPKTHPFATEICDGKDNDCDGLVDEGNPDGAGAPLGTVKGGNVTSCTDSDVGICAGPKNGGAGVGHCVCSALPVDQHHFDKMRTACPTEPDPKMAGSAAHCYFAVQPKPEVCNGLDDDCNASTNELEPKDHAAEGFATDCPGPLDAAKPNICCAIPMSTSAPMCVDALTDPDNCGGCGAVDPKHICSGNGLVARTCGLFGGGRPVMPVCNGACKPGAADCNDDKQADGCETDSYTVTNCGPGGMANGGRGAAAGCGNVCSAQNGTPSCPAGACLIVCDKSWANCDGVVGNTGANSNGCEANTVIDPDNCGPGGAMNAGCGQKCSSANMASRTCVGGVCSGDCQDGFADCNGDKLPDGCETSTFSVTNCGPGGKTNGGRGAAAGCGKVCSAVHGKPGCAAGTCTIACDAQWANCDGIVGDSGANSNGCEVNTFTDPNNCGAGGADNAGCGLKCAGNHVVAATCAAGVCSGACNVGWADCNGNRQSDGCEVSTFDVNNCGPGGGTNNGQGMAAGCGAVCSAQNGTPSCITGACTIVCNPGFGNCNGIVGNTGAGSDGCEVNTLSDANNCGAGGALNAGCGVVCSMNHVAIRTCSGGVCNGDCAAGFADCNNNKQADGCEINILTDAGNCGGCGTSCAGSAAGHVCLGGTCGCNAAADCPTGRSCNTVTHVCEVACGAGHTGCNGGCCDGASCVAGTSLAACGQSGGACAACGAGQSCNTSTGACEATCGANHTACNGGCCAANLCVGGIMSDACGSNGLACLNCIVNPSGSACLMGTSCGCNVAADCPAGTACNTMTKQCEVACGGGNHSVCNGGCCSAGNLCVAGTANNACGGAGGACVDCAGSPDGTQCVVGNRCGCNVAAECPVGNACNLANRLCSASCAPGVSTTNCNGGCCDPGGACRPGNLPTACGSDGGTCAVCGANQACDIATKSCGGKCGLGYTICNGGCCNGTNNNCVPGTNNGSCGNTGGACVACVAPTPNCNAGVCGP